MRKKTSSDLKPPNSWPALAASWQSVFDFLYWGAHPDEPGHNRSSSPFTTPADIAERKVLSTGAGQPKYWRKTWFGANAYNAKFGVPNYTYKKCSDFCCHSVGCHEAPGKHQKYQSVWVLPDRVIHRGAQRKKRKKTEKVQKSWSPTAPATNYSHCNLISTSRRIDTGSAISNRLFDVPEPRESYMWVLKNR